MNAKARSTVWIRMATVAVSMMFLSSCQKSTPVATSAPVADVPKPGESSKGQDDGFKILEQKHLNGTLVFRVTMQNLDAAKEVAEALIKHNTHEDMVRVFFYDTGLPDPMGNAQLLYEWTRQSGLVLRYDLRLPPVKESLNQSFPEYTVLNRKTSNDKRVSGDILIPGLSRRTKPKEIERVCRIICYEEDIDDCSIYSTMDDYDADQFDASGGENSTVLKRNILCSIQNGKFIPPSN